MIINGKGMVQRPRLHTRFSFTSTTAISTASLKFCQKISTTQVPALGTVQYLWQYGTGKLFFPGPKVAMAPYDFFLK